MSDDVVVPRDDEPAEHDPTGLDLASQVARQTAGGNVALASGRFSLGQVAVPVAVGVGAGTGVPIVTSTVTATI